MRLDRSLFDHADRRDTGALVAGIDEAGRGPLAGPVIAAAVILDESAVPDGIADSKTLDAATRERLCAALQGTAMIGIGAASTAEIDRLNILAATMLAMQRAVARLPQRPTLALIDGNRAPDLPCAVRTMIKGDTRSPVIGAASIVAKVVRDRIMARLAIVHPGFGWERNAGYPTPEHKASLRHLGPTAHHRKSFGPVREVLASGAPPVSLRAVEN